MKKKHYHIISPLWAFACAGAMAFVSCSSNRSVVRSDGRRPPVAEITLDDLINSRPGSVTGGSNVELSSKARSLVDAAHKWLGTPYKYGGETRRGIDCSALIMNVYRDALGVKLPRTSRSQRDYASNVSRGNLMPGDLVFFSSAKNRSGISHVGLYIGGDRFIHASSSRGVVVSKLSEKYFMNHYHSSGRVLDLADAPDNEIALPGDEAGSAMELQAELLDAILTATIDSIYSMPVDDDPNLAPGL